MQVVVLYRISLSYTINRLVFIHQPPRVLHSLVNRIHHLWTGLLWRYHTLQGTCITPSQWRSKSEPYDCLYIVPVYQKDIYGFDVLTHSADCSYYLWIRNNHLYLPFQVTHTQCHWLRTTGSHWNRIPWIRDLRTRTSELIAYPCIFTTHQCPIRISVSGLVIRWLSHLSRSVCQLYTDLYRRHLFHSWAADMPNRLPQEQYQDGSMFPGFQTSLILI